MDALLREWQKMLDETQPYSIPLDPQSSLVRVKGVGRCRFGLATFRPSVAKSTVIMVTTNDSITRTLPVGWRVIADERKLVCPTLVSAEIALEWWPYDRLIVFPKVPVDKSDFVELCTETDGGTIILRRCSGQPVIVDFFLPCQNCPTRMDFRLAGEKNAHLNVDLGQLFLPASKDAGKTSVLGEEFWRNHAWRWSNERIGLLRSP